MDLRVRIAWVAAALAAGLACDAGPAGRSSQDPAVTPRTELRDPAPPRGRMHLPVRFEENRGQAGEGVRFVAQAAGYAAWVADDAIGFATAGSGRWNRVFPVSLRLSWGATPDVEARGLDPRATVVGYAAGAAADEAIEGVRTFGSVELADVVPGVRLGFRDDEGRVRMRISAESAAALSRLELRFAGLDAPELDAEGGLVMRGRQGLARASAPELRPAGRDELLEGGFEIDSESVVRVRAPEDAAGPLRVDFRFELGNFVGARPEASLRTRASLPSVAVGADGRVFLAGDSVEPRPPFGPPGPYAGGRNGFVACLDLGGEAPEVLWVRHLGGSDNDGVSGLAVGPEGRVLAAGWSRSQQAFAGLEDGRREWTETTSAVNFVIALDGATSQPLAGQVLTLGSLGLFGPRVVFDASATGSPVIVAGNATVGPGHPDDVMRGTAGVFGERPFGGGDGYVAGLDAELSEVSWFTYLGGSGGEAVLGVAAADGSVYVAGSTSSSNFPEDESSPVCSQPCAPFVAKLSADGERLEGVRRLGAAPEALDAPIALATVAGETPLAMWWSLASDAQQVAPLAEVGAAPPWQASVPAWSGPALGAGAGGALAGSASADAIALVAIDGETSRTLASAAGAGQLSDVDLSRAGRAIAAGVYLAELGPDAPRDPAPVPGEVYFLLEAEASP